MRTREEIENLAGQSRTGEMIRNGGSQAFTLGLILEILLDIRDLLTQHNSEV